MTELFPNAAKKLSQRTLFASGVTSHVKLPSGREVEEKGDDVAASLGAEKVGAYSCKLCNFFTP